MVRLNENYVQSSVKLDVL